MFETREDAEMNSFKLLDCEPRMMRRATIMCPKEHIRTDSERLG
jgi:hypothetical protein